MLLTRLRQLALYLGKSTLSSSHPSEVFLEPTNRCNLNCTSCPRSVMTRPVGAMPLSLFHDIIDQLTGHTEMLHMYGYGEPLIHPRLPEMVSYASQKGLATSFATNGMLLTPDISHSLLEAGLSHLIVSIDTEDAAAYRKQRIGGDFDAVVANIRAFAEAKRELGGRTRVVVSALMTDRLLAHLDDFLKFSRSLPASGQRFESYINVVDEPLFSKGKPKKTAFAAHNHFYLWRKLYIQWNGKAFACPQNIHLDDPELIAGDLESQSVAEVWNGNRIRDMRAAALRGSAPNALCKNCGFPSHPVWMYAGKVLLGERLFLVRVQPWLTTNMAVITAISASHPKTRSHRDR